LHSTYQYTLNKPVTADEIAFTYQGQFNGSAAIWHVTLRPCYPTQNKQDASPKKQTLEVTADKFHPGHFHASLQIAQQSLSQGDIIKTIILLNQYKNLQLGIHHWGA